MIQKICLFLLIGFSALAQNIVLQTLATGFSSPVAIVHSGDSRLFVVQRGGLIRILNADGTINATPFLDVSSLIVSGGERGLLGLAFHPDYNNNGLFFVNYTRSGDGATVIARYQVSSNPNIANASSAQVILTISQPYTNHNGGTIVFGPDGFLYIGMGDGGSGGDPQNFAQNIQSHLGKMLRIDVTNQTTYQNPNTNPFFGATTGLDEIFFVGMRNPWKFSFNRLNGDMWIADVGQNAREEINKIPNPMTPGLNFGWRCYEANIVYNTTGCVAMSNYFFPVASYNLGGGYCSVTGGYVYTGNIYPNLQNKYLFADYCANRIGWIDAVNPGAITWSTNFSGNFSTFGEDVNGELYIAGISNGTISKIVDTTLSLADENNASYQVYPNPTSENLYVQWNGNEAPNRITLWNIHGQKMEVPSSFTENKISIDVRSLTKGVYFLQTENNGTTKTQKVIIQ
jgi:glucose/arabinose dehydrogenase